MLLEMVKLFHSTKNKNLFSNADIEILEEEDKLRPKYYFLIE